MTLARSSAAGGCYCEADFDLTGQETAPGAGPAGSSPGSDGLAGRVGQWQELAAAATSVDHTSDSIRLVLPPRMLAAVAELCAAEIACSQARFRLEVTASQLTLAIEAAGSAGLLETLLSARTPTGQ